MVKQWFKQIPRFPFALALVGFGLIVYYAVVLRDLFLAMIAINQIAITVNYYREWKVENEVR